MLALQFIRDNPDLVRKAATDKGIHDAPVDRILKLDEERRHLIQEVETRQAGQKALNKSIAAQFTVSGSKPAVVSPPSGEMLEQAGALKREIQQYEEALVK